MFIFLINRKGKTHIVDYYFNSRYRAVCGEVFYKKNHLNTLAADNTFKQICKNCQKAYDDMYASDLEFDPKAVYGNPHRLQDWLEFNSVELYGPKEDYLLDISRVWGKLNRYKHLVNRNKKFYG